MTNSRNVIRRTIEFTSVAGSAAACIQVGSVGPAVALHTQIMSGQLALQELPHFTALVLNTVPFYPLIGYLSAFAVLTCVIVTFVLTKNEDTRLQVVLTASIVGFSISLQMAIAIGVGLILIPTLANGM